MYTVGIYILSFKDTCSEIWEGGVEILHYCYIETLESLEQTLPTCRILPQNYNLDFVSYE